MNRNSYKFKNNGFTLVEMLIVIAIIAILVAILVPTILGAVSKSKAATDAANLKAVMSVINVAVLDGSTYEEAASDAAVIECKTFPDAEVYAIYSDGAFFEVFFVNGNVAYGTEYFVEIINTGAGSTTYKLDELSAKYEVIKMYQDNTQE